MPNLFETGRPPAILPARSASRPDPAEKTPQNDAARNRDVDRMLGPGLRDFDGPVAPVDGLLPHAVDLVAEDERITRPRIDGQRVEHRRALDLLDGQHLVAVGVQAVDTRFGGLVIAPRHGQLRAQRRFMDVAVGRHGRNPAQGDMLHGESVPRAEERPHVLQRTDVVEHDRNGHLLHRGELSGRGTPQLLVGDFSHNGCKRGISGAKVVKK